MQSGEFFSNSMLVSALMTELESDAPSSSSSSSSQVLFLAVHDDLLPQSMMIHCHNP
jgi:hypothetical protein